MTSPARHLAVGGDGQGTSAHPRYRGLDLLKALPWLLAATALLAFALMAAFDVVLAWAWAIDMFIGWPCLLLACTMGSAVDRLGKNVLAAWLGSINYELYVWHAVLDIGIATVCAARGVPIPVSRLALLFCLLACEAIASLLYLTLEKPLNKAFSSSRLGSA